MMNDRSQSTTFNDLMSGEPLRRWLPAPFAEVVQLSDAYKLLRGLIGFLAITVAPIVVLADHLIGGREGLRQSVSAYYHGTAGGWFVGSLFAIAVFLLTYESKPRSQGDDRKVDRLHSSFAGICAGMVALFPTFPTGATGTEATSKTIHGVAATLLFISLAVFSLYHFTKTDGEVDVDTPWSDRLQRIFRTNWECVETHYENQGIELTDQKRWRNTTYRVCGWLIVAALVGAAVGHGNEENSIFFWSEVLAVTAFGFSWLVKGGAVKPFNDPQEPCADAQGPASEHRVRDSAQDAVLVL